MSPHVLVEIPKRLPWQAEASRLLEEPGVRFLALNMGRRAGKTQWIADECGEYALDHGRELSLLAAPTYDLTLPVVERVQEYWGPLISWHKSTRIGTLPNGHRIVVRTCESDAALGRGYHRIYLDEAARVSDAVLDGVLKPAVGDTGGKIIAVSTPTPTLFSWWRKWCVRGQSTDWPLYRYAHGVSTENPNPLVQSYVEEMRGDLPEVVFRREFLAEFMDDAGAVFRGHRDAATSSLKEPRPGASYVLGVDLARLQDYTVVCPLDVETGEVGPLDRFHGLSWDLQEQRIAEAARRWNGATAVVDATGLGDVVVEGLQTGLNIGSIIGVTLTGAKKDTLITGLAIALERGDLQLPPDEGLLGELDSYSYETTSSGRYRYQARSGYTDDRVVALALALHGLHGQSGLGLLSYMRERLKEQQRATLPIGRAA